jgi:hypothetical protein
MEIPSNMPLQSSKFLILLHILSHIFDDILYFVVEFRCCEVDNNERMRKEKAKEKDKEKEKSKGKSRNKNTSLEGENCLNLSLLADLRYVIFNLYNYYHTIPCV